MNPASQLIEVRDSSHVGEVRRAAAFWAERAGLETDRRHDAGIVATEVATNLLKHAGGGLVLVQRGFRGGVEIIALDRGPGIADPTLVMQDGYSTAGTTGNGLGAVRRMATSFDLYSRRTHGTAVYALVSGGAERALRPAEVARGKGGFEVGAVCVAMKGEEVCGDAYACTDGPNGCFAAIADGLGHGPLAAEASTAALQVFTRTPASTVMSIIAESHDALRATRGAAMSVAQVHPHLRTVRYCGVGNITGVVAAGATVRRMVTHNGTLGMGTPRMTEFTYPWEPGATMILHSDGLGTRWDLGQYPGLSARRAALIAAVLYRDFARERDDVTVLVVREAPE